MTTSSKRLTAFIMSLIMIIAAVLIFVPPVNSAASSRKISYTLSGSDKSVTIAFKHSADNTKIYYTTNGKAPSKSSTLYIGAITVYKKTLIRAVEYDGSGRKYASLKKTLTPMTCAPLAETTYSGTKRYITFSCETPGAVIFYTTDGSKPDTSSIKYTGTFEVPQDTQIKARAYAKNYKSSSVITLSSVYSDAEQVAQIVNSERAKKGLVELKLDPGLCVLASARAKEIAQSWGHTRPDGRSCFTIFEDYGYSGYYASGENIAAGQRTAREVMDSWLASTGHRENILRDYFRSIGVGVYEENGYRYWVQLFTDGKEEI